jgi:hypothetical protein
MYSTSHFINRRASVQCLVLPCATWREPPRTGNPSVASRCGTRSTDPIVVRTATLTAQLPPKIMTFKFCELSAAIGYATCYYENHEDSDLDEALAIALNEFIPPLDHLRMKRMRMRMRMKTKNNHENIDKQVERAISYYLRFTLKNRQTIERELQQAAITNFNLNDRQISEFRLKIYQLNMASQYTSQYNIEPDDD